MPRRKPGPSLSLSSALFCILVILPLIAAAQQQQSHHDDARRRSTAAGKPILGSPLKSRAPQLKSARHHKNGKDTAIIPSDERALATFAPADSNPAVRAPPARSSAQSAGLSSRHPARSLQDWQVEDIILLATVDGTIYARDRKTGTARWELEADRPMVETIYHRNKSAKAAPEDDDFIWIVEPSQDGSLYVYAPGPQSGVQKLGLTVKQLVEELSPYAGEDPPVVYTADKKNTLYTVDAATGSILKMFSSTGSITNEDRSCKRVNALESLEDDECEPIGTLTLGRTEYTVAIQDKITGDALCTIRYFEWGPNNRDKDLHGQYASSIDNKYVYVQHDGGVTAVHYRPSSDSDAKIVFTQKFSSPVARVYDVVRPSDETSSDPSLVLLPQPIGPAGGDEFQEDKIFVNCTETGSWYAMSEQKYPTVTDGASNAICYTDDVLNDATFLDGKVSPRRRNSLVGIHPLSPITQDGQSIFTISGLDQYPTIGAPPELTEDNTALDIAITRAKWTDSLPSAWLFVLALIGLWTLSSNWAQAQKVWTKAQKIVTSKTAESTAAAPVPAVPKDAEEEKVAPAAPAAPIEPEQRKVRFPEPAEETVFPVEDVQQDSDEKNQSDDMAEVRVGSPNSAAPIVLATAPPPDTARTPPEESTPTKPKKKASRGVRGGRKTKEKRQEQLEAQQRSRANSQANAKEASDAIVPRMQALQTSGVGIISLDASESPDVSGKIQINNLVIDTDQCIGHGSAGTCVFEGTWEGKKKVAVKRMLSQYYELASSEVSFLQENEHHNNVIHYYCQQRDQHFLYIAVELCQASLWDLFYSETKDETRRQQLSGIVTAIQKDIPKALYQLVEGLSHLHDLRIIHRDIKPQNILIANPRKTQPNELRLVISDFGLCKTLPENASTLIDPTSNAGTCGWKAPELISQPKDASSNNGHSNMSQPNDSQSSANGGSSQGVKRAADIFSLGCLFFWVLTGGSHPFDDKEGWVMMRELNIKKNNLQNMHKLDLGSDSEEPMQLITAMLAHRPEDRPTAKEIKSHPFFWDAEKRLAFLCDVSDHFEHEPRDPPSHHLDILENWAEDVLGGDFLRRLDRAFIDTLGKQRKYTGARMLDLLRALRNKKNHYEDMPEDVKKRVGALPDGYLLYWTSRFPKLLMACYWVVRDCRVDGNSRFRRYFSA